jgi:UDP-N-acetylmuramyl pentapeptide phosphotransferase/UDP-N-acetylglucosamine-1-phosphate transferase
MMAPEPLLYVVCIAFAASALLTWRLSQPGSRFFILDHPNPRSLHSRPTPRTGGIAIVAAIVLAGMLAAALYGNARQLGWVAAAALLVAVTSYIDDRTKLPALRRIVVHVMASAVVIYGGFVLDMRLAPGDSGALAPWMVWPITLLYLVWMVNLYNFMDGMDGFASGMALFGFGTLAVFGVLAGNELFAAICLVVAAAAGGFLLFNFPPARIFMGDTGSSTLGLLAGVISIWGAQDGVFPFWASLLVFSPFIVDATVTLIRRLAAGEKLWEAHRTHYYQRLVQSGWGHRGTVLREYALMAACAVSALWATAAFTASQWAVVGFWICAYALFGVAVQRRERANKKMG